MHRAPGTPGAGQASGPGGTGRRAGGGSPPDPPPRSPLWARRPQPRPPWHHVARACPQGGGQAPGRVGWWAGTRAAGLAPPADRLFQGEGLLGHCWQERRGSGEQVRTSTAARGKDGHPLSGGHCFSVFSRDQGWEGEGPVLGWAPSPGKGRLLPERLWRVTHAQVPGRPALALPSWEGAPRIVRTKFQQTSGSRPAANRLAVLLLSLRPLSFNLERLRFFFFAETLRVCNAAGASGGGDPGTGHQGRDSRAGRRVQCAQRPPGGARCRDWGGRGCELRPRARLAKSRRGARRGTGRRSPSCPPGSRGRRPGDSVTPHSCLTGRRGTLIAVGKDRQTFRQTAKISSRAEPGWCVTSGLGSSREGESPPRVRGRHFMQSRLPCPLGASSLPPPARGPFPRPSSTGEGRPTGLPSSSLASHHWKGALGG